MSSIITAAQSFRTEVLRGDRDMLRQLSAAYSEIARRLKIDLDALMRDIKEAQRQGKTVNRDWLRRSLRYQSLIRQAQLEISTYSNGALRFIESRQRSAIDLGQDHATDLIQRGAEITFARLPSEAIQEMVGVLEDGSPLSKVLDRLGKEAAGQIRSNLIAGLGQGQSVQKIAQSIRQAIDVPRWKALQVSRTEVLRSYRQSTLATYAANGDVLDGWTWLSTLSTRTCAACWALHGTFFPLSKQFFPAHVSCFPAGVSVTGPGVRATSTRWYEGELVDLEFASGKSLSVTPNHPILTANGWIAAGLLNEGSNVVRSLDGEAAARLVDPNNYQVPTLIENVSNARFSESSMVAVSVPTAPEDFHGDGRGSNISVIRTNRELWDAITNSSFAEHLREPQLVWGRVGLSLLSRFGASDLLFKGLFPVGSRDVSGGDIAGVLFGSALCHHHAVGFGAIATLNSSNTQTSFDHLPRNVERFRESVFRLSGQITSNDFRIGQSGSASQRSSAPALSESVSSGLVAEQSPSLQLIAESLLVNSKLGSKTLSALTSNISFDRVLKVSHRGFSGHVYNLETETGWYIADGILTHNCRCTSIPSVKGSKTNVQSGSVAFAELPVEDQRFILGPTKYEMYAAGMPLEDFVMKKRSNEWGESYTTRSLTNLSKRQEQREQLRTALAKAGDRAKGVLDRINRGTRKAA